MVRKLMSVALRADVGRPLGERQVGTDGQNGEHGEVGAELPSKSRFVVGVRERSLHHTGRSSDIER